VLPTISAFALCAFAFVAFASGPEHKLDIVDRTPKFKAFYDQAIAQALTSNARFGLWKKEYGYAAVPPGPEGEAMARKLLDSAWKKYPALLPRLSRLTADAKADAKYAFNRINELYKTQSTPIQTRLILFVGQFDNNAFSIPAMNGKPATTVMEVDDVALRTTLAHELAHTVHFQLAHVKNGFGAPVGETMFLEGLAMRTAQQVYAGLPETVFTEMPQEKGWLKRCYANQERVVSQIAKDLDKSGREVALKYTFGNGNTGMHREAYCAAWIVMGKLLKSGKTLADLARIPEGRMVDAMRCALSSR